MKHDFYVPVVQQMALNNVPLRNGPRSQNLGEEPIFIFLYSEKMIKRSFHFYARPQNGQFYMINVLEN